MEITIGLLMIYLSNFAFSKYMDKLSKEKVDEFLKRIKKDNESIQERLSKLIPKYNKIIKFIPILNMYLYYKKYQVSKVVIKLMNSLVELEYPEIFYERIAKERDEVKKSRILEKKEYFIGRIIDGKVYNISFYFDGYDFVILKDQEWVRNLNDDELRNILFDLLFIYKFSDEHDVNSSYNLNEIYSPDLMKALLLNQVEKGNFDNDLQINVNNEEREAKIILTRKKTI